MLKQTKRRQGLFPLINDKSQIPEPVENMRFTHWQHSKFSLLADRYPLLQLSQSQGGKLWSSLEVAPRDHWNIPTDTSGL